MNRRRFPLFLSVGLIIASLSGIACSESSPTGPSALTTMQMLIQQLQDRGVTVSVAEVMPQSSFPFFSVNAQRLIVNGQRSCLRVSRFTGCAE